MLWGHMKGLLSGRRIVVELYLESVTVGLSSGERRKA